MPFNTLSGRGLSITGKLELVMIVLLLAVATVLGLEVVAIRHDTALVQRQTALAVSADGPTQLLISLQDEQAWAAVELIGVDESAQLVVEGYDETRRRTDAALAGFRKLLDRSPPETRRAFAPAMRELDEDLGPLRQEIDDDKAPRDLNNLEHSNASFAEYFRLILPMFAGTRDVAAVIDNRELRQGAELIDLANRQVATLGQLGREVGVTSVLSGGIKERSQIVAVGAWERAFVHLSDELRARTTGRYAEAGGDKLFVGFTKAMVDQSEDALQGTFDTEEFLATINPSADESFQAYRERVGTILRDRADHLSDAAAQRERLYLALIVLTAGAAAGIVLLVSRSVARPLRLLAQQMRHTAHHALRQAVDSVLRAPLGTDVEVPAIDEISVAGDDEVREVATVMNTVQHAVVDLAVEQALLRRNVADSFISLGRRNQNLLSRQLDFITQLQQDEVDSDVLAYLFQLDHLATRMRRNAESLLVLVGNESARRWRAPVAILDVVRAAVSEVEDYQRVQLAGLDPDTVDGSAAIDVVHLLAELIENALMFSPRQQPVTIRGVAYPDPGTAYVLAIEDVGLGMPPDAIEQANRRLAGGEPYTVAPSKYLGHYVAGSLAVRHGLRLHLQQSAGPGITALVYFPLSLSLSEAPGPEAHPVGQV